MQRHSRTKWLLWNQNVTNVTSSLLSINILLFFLISIKNFRWSNNHSGVNDSKFLIIELKLAETCLWFEMGFESTCLRFSYFTLFYWMCFNSFFYRFQQFYLEQFVPFKHIWNSFQSFVFSSIESLCISVHSEAWTRQFTSYFYCSQGIISTVVKIWACKTKQWFLWYQYT